MGEGKGITYEGSYRSGLIQFSVPELARKRILVCAKGAVSTSKSPVIKEWDSVEKVQW